MAEAISRCNESTLTGGTHLMEVWRGKWINQKNLLTGQWDPCSSLWFHAHRLWYGECSWCVNESSAPIAGRHQKILVHRDSNRANYWWGSWCSLIDWDCDCNKCGREWNCRSNNLWYDCADQWGQSGPLIAPMSAKLIAPMSARSETERRGCSQLSVVAAENYFLVKALWRYTLRVLIHEGKMRVCCLGFSLLQ